MNGARRMIHNQSHMLCTMWFIRDFGNSKRKEKNTYTPQQNKLITHALKSRMCTCLCVEPFEIRTLLKRSEPACLFALYMHEFFLHLLFLPFCRIHDSARYWVATNVVVSILLTHCLCFLSSLICIEDFMILSIKTYFNQASYISCWN